MENLDYKDLVAVTALLIHASKIDEHYSEEEKILINNFIKSLNTNNYDNIKIIDEAEQLEKDSNQLLTFTNIIKKKNEEFKTVIIKQLWKLIISDNSVDHYESNLMRRICGLIYFSDKLSGEIKLELLNKKKI
jgi:uncharacterized tellurite resistance protein B-like protein|tara:strand:+ start:315 stop:713 length:399 start_codon:yes stop_codon:yes gene_type:complete